ncbi:MAG TPA: arginine N-succinyltransferase [bacterium]|nr:arginine N-succinyltransferase [bacterium]
MGDLTTLCSVFAGLHNSVFSAGLANTRLHPLAQPSVLLRETLPSDAPRLLEVARSGNFRTLNFPSDLDGLTHKIDRSRLSFRREIADPALQEMMFTVLERNGRDDYVPVGTSTFFPQHGTARKPHHAYQVVPGTRVDDAGLVHDDTVLQLIQNHAGPAEVGGLIVHADRSAGRVPYGRAVSWVRFFWTSLPGRRADYANRLCLTEILPPFVETPEGGRTNAFYEAHARRFFEDRTYEEMDKLTNADCSLITARLPRTVRLADMPSEARALIGVPRKESRPALRLLEKVGFKPTGQVDPIDAGPHFLGAFADNPIFTGAHDLIYGGTSHREDEIPNWHYGFVGRERHSDDAAFRAALGAFLVMDDLLLTTREIADFLDLRVGSLEPVTAVAL